jgi:cyclohexyl-isocyanide hydratase
MLRGDHVAQAIQLAIEYAPEPPFDSGTPKTARPEILRAVTERGREMKERREATAKRIAAQLGIV